MNMDTFLIRSANSGGSLEFFDRSPIDPQEPIGEFWVRVIDHDLSATGRVYAGYASSHPAHIFAEMARQWSGWKGDKAWESLEGEMRLRCSHDRLGHIRIAIELQSGPYDWEWHVRAAIMAEAGQLDRIASDAAEFFGRPS
jgi:uncharacterized protein DUF6228